jgi:predicted nuclease of restriction endonuclease-like RecB superfamily
MVLWRGQKVFVPDFLLRHVDGRQAMLEIVGFWAPEYLKAKAETLQAFAGERILLAVAESHRHDAPALAHDPIWFRSAVSVEAVLARLRREFESTPGS